MCVLVREFEKSLWVHPKSSPQAMSILPGLKVIQIEFYSCNHKNNTNSVCIYVYVCTYVIIYIQTLTNF